MALIKVIKAINVEKIYCKVTCPECEGTVSMKMKGAVTRKNCPKCNRGTYVFTITPMPGEITITVVFINHCNVSREYPLSPADVEIEE